MSEPFDYGHFDIVLADYFRVPSNSLLSVKKKPLMPEMQKMVLPSYNLICLSAPTANGVCGQTAFRSLYSANIWMKLVISVLWNITTFRQQMVIWMM